ncbi:MAG: solute carrier family 23 protein, partial [Oscillospiraceae bacterium]
MKKSKTVIGDEGIYDARELGAPKMLILGFQHMFAMFGATILVPALTGLSVSATLLFAGLGTLLFHLISKGKVPAFLGSSFAFLAGYWAIAPNKEPELLPYACFGVACAGLVYVILSGLFKIFGPQKVMRFFPPIVTGPVIICIGLTLSSTAVSSCSSNWWIALVAIAVVIICNIFGKGMIKIIPILLGVIASYLVAALSGNVDFKTVADAAWLGWPFQWQNTVFGIFSGKVDTGLLITAVIICNIFGKGMIKIIPIL